MTPWPLAILAAVLAACSSTPDADRIAPTVLTDVAVLECPAPEVIRLDPALIEPLSVEPPQLVPAGQGDYGITRAAAELMIDTLRAFGERLARIRAAMETL